MCPDQIPLSFRDKPYARQHFARIVEWARDHHPFYQARFNDKLPDIPILTRSEILEHNDLLLYGYAESGRTSGSTGIPVRISWSKARANQERKDTAEFVSWLGGPLPRTRIIYAPDDKNSDFLDINTAIDKQIRHIQQRNITAGAVAITTYPTNAVQLSSAILEAGVDMRFIQRVGCFSEVFESHQEALIQQAFPNAKIWSTYSATEFGMIAARCPHEPEFHHVMAHKLGVEVLDEANQPCADGEIGRLVITDYMNRQSSLIRYEIGDLAAREQCPCGKIKLPSLGKIIGKIRGVLKHRDGRYVMFTDLSVALRDIPGMHQYQVIQKSLEHFVLRYAGDEFDDLATTVNECFRQHFGYLPTIELQQENVIERGTNGKFYASICEL